MKIGNYLYHWYYGQMQITAIEGDYIKLKILDADNVYPAKPDHEDIKKWSSERIEQETKQREELKKNMRGYETIINNHIEKETDVLFSKNSIGYILHEEKQDAIFSNQPLPSRLSNNIEFPLYESKFHKTYKGDIERAKGEGSLTDSDYFKTVEQEAKENPNNNTGV